MNECKWNVNASDLQTMSDLARRQFGTAEGCKSVSAVNFTETTLLGLPMRASRTLAAPYCSISWIHCGIELKVDLRVMS